MKTTNTLLFLLLILWCSCKKEMNYKSIHFDYADGYAGTYHCVKEIYNDFPNQNIDTTITIDINVLDLRTDTKCLFYIHSLQDTIIVLSDGYFYRYEEESIVSSHGKNYFRRIGYFQNDSIFYSENSKFYIDGYLYFTSYIELKGAKN